MEKIYKDGEVLEATDLNGSFSELETKINKFIEEYTRDPYVIIDGKKYPVTGVIQNPGGWRFKANYSNNFNGSFQVPTPFPITDEYTFETFTLGSSGYTHVTTIALDYEKQLIFCRVYQGGADTPGSLQLIGYRLVRNSKDPNRLLNQ